MEALRSRSGGRVSATLSAAALKEETGSVGASSWATPASSTAPLVLGAGLPVGNATAAAMTETAGAAVGDSSGVGGGVGGGGVRSVDSLLAYRSEVQRSGVDGCLLVVVFVVPWAPACLKMKSVSSPPPLLQLCSLASCRNYFTAELIIVVVYSSR